MQTFHDGLSTQFRASVMKILAADGYQAKKTIYDQSITITDRDNLIKYGERQLGKYSKGELENYIRWQCQIESEKKMSDKLMELDAEIMKSEKKLLNNPSISSVNRKILIQSKQISIQNKENSIEFKKTLRSMSEMCRQAVVNMLKDIAITSDSRCKLAFY